MVRRAWRWLRSRFSSNVLGTTSESVPGLDGGLSPVARIGLGTVAITVALAVGAIAGAPWGVLFFFPALMVSGLFGGTGFALFAWFLCVVLAVRFFMGSDLVLFAIASAIETGAALLLRQLFRESRRWGVRYRRLLAAMASAVTVSDAEGRIGWPHPELARLIGMTWPDYAGTGWLKAVHPDDVAKIVPDGPYKDVAIQRAEIRLKDPASGDWRWHLMQAVPLLDADGEIEEWVSTLTDIHERRLSGEQQDMMAGEARHRLKNLMAIIDALVKSSRPRDPDPAVEAYRKKLQGRLQALSAAGDLALASNYSKMQVREVVAATLAPFLESGSARITFGGPGLSLGEATGGSLAMGLHELATNAIKHGALSVPGGRVRFDWTVLPTKGGRQVEMVWKESGGPAPTRPVKDGFGTRVIAFIAAREHNGQVTAEFPPDGYVCRIAFTLLDETHFVGERTR